MANGFGIGLDRFAGGGARGMGGGGGTPGLPPAPVSAQQTFADLTRQAWQEYMSRFMPLENLLIDYATDPEEVTKAVTRARESVATQFEAQEGITERGLRSRQITLTPEERAAAERERNLTRSLADVQAANLAREQTVSRQRSILGQPMPSVEVPAGLGK